MKRLVPAGLLQGQAAVATKLGLEAPMNQQQHQERQSGACRNLLDLAICCFVVAGQNRMSFQPASLPLMFVIIGFTCVGARFARSQPTFQVPSLFNLLGSDSRPEEQNQCKDVASMRLDMNNNLASMVGRRPAGISGLPLGLVGSTLAASVPPLFSASSSPLGLMRKKCYGVSSPQPYSLVSNRAYGSEGELVGSAFLLTTDIMFWSG